MPNVTVNVDEESYRRARIVAAHRGVSVSKLIRDFFHSLQANDEVRQSPVEELFAAMDREGSNAQVGARERDRSKLYDR